MKHAKRKSFPALALVALLFVSFLLAGCEAEESRGGYHASVLNATADFYINDFAGLFTEEQRTTMVEKAADFSNRTGGIQVVISTVESLDSCVTDGSKGLDITQVSYAMYEQYGIGKDDMGLLVLFSVGDRDVWAMSGRQMQFYITDERAGELIDNYAMDYFQQDQFADGLTSLQDGIFSEIQAVVPQDWNASQEAPVETEAPPKAPEESNQPTEPEMVPVAEKQGKDYGIIGAFLALVAGFVFSIKGLFSKGKKHQKEMEELKAKHSAEMDALQKACIEEQAEQQAVWKEAEQKFRADIQTWQNRVSQTENVAAQTQMGLQQTIGKLETAKKDLEYQLAVLQDRFNRAKRLHPEIDFKAEIDKMIEDEYRDEAKRTDDVLENTLALPADKDNVQAFLEAISYYQNINPEIQKYMQTDVQKLHNLFEESKTLQQEFERAEQEKADRASAQAVYEELLAVSQKCPTGTHENEDVLRDTIQKYNSLNRAAKGFFPDARLVQTLQNLLKVAEADTRNLEAGKQAENDVESIIRRVGYRASENDLERLTNAMRIYQRLSKAEAAYFSVDLYNKLKKLLGEAQDDKEDQDRRRRRQREEAARRAAASSSISSTTRHTGSFGGGHSGGHSGFGGRPSGGGAGRHF